MYVFTWMIKQLTAFQFKFNSSNYSILWGQIQTYLWWNSREKKNKSFQNFVRSRTASPTFSPAGCSDNLPWEALWWQWRVPCSLPHEAASVSSYCEHSGLHCAAPGELSPLARHLEWHGAPPGCHPGPKHRKGEEERWKWKDNGKKKDSC